MNWIAIAEILHILISIGLSIKILMDSSTSVKASAYILLIFLIPIAGVIIYLAFGLNHRKRKIYSKKIIDDEQKIEEIIKKVNLYRKENLPLFQKEHPQFNGLKNLLFKDVKSLLTRSNHLKLLVGGEEKYPELLNSIRAAKKHIHLEYYIYEAGNIGNEIGDLLIKKAKEGVKVRFIYDGFGSRKISKSLVKRMRNQGVEAFPFYEIKFPFLANRLNYRNHRKIVVIDGNVGFIGGLNISDRYDNRQKNKCYWQDFHLKVEGMAAWYLQQAFIADWNFSSGQRLAFAYDLFNDFKITENTTNNWVQIATSGPDSKYPSILYSFLEAINSSQKEILITTPYFIPGLEFIRSLKIAALRGISIKIIVPKRGDSKFVNAVSKSHYEELLEVGIEVYLYKKGFIHAKSMICDEEVSILGTANLDHRSFDLNFEVNAVVYSKSFSKELKATFDYTLKESIKLDYEVWKERPFIKKLGAKALGLISPLM